MNEKKSKVLVGFIVIGVAVWNIWNTLAIGDLRNKIIARDETINQLSFDLYTKTDKTVKQLNYDLDLIKKGGQADTVDATVTSVPTVEKATSSNDKTTVTSDKTTSTSETTSSTQNPTSEKTSSTTSTTQTKTSGSTKR